MELPSTEMINDQRIVKFKQKITDTLASEEIGMFRQMVEQYQDEHNIPAIEIAAVLALLMQGETPFLLSNKPSRKAKDDWDKADSSSSRGRKPSRNSRERDRTPRRDRSSGNEAPPDKGMQRYRLEVGHNNEVKPGNIVGAIANEADIDSKNIGRINIFDDHTLVDLPENLPKDVMTKIKKARVAGKTLNISAASKDGSSANDYSAKSESHDDKKEKKRTKGKIKLKNKDKGKPKDKKKAKKKVRTNRPAVNTRRSDD